ncbi:MAG: hypothetical protein AMXMBFR47_36080 [Planctomycetota bacterium]
MVGGGYNVEPAVSPAGDIIVAGDAIRSYSPSGSLLWEFDAPDSEFPPGTQQFFTPAISTDNHVYVGQFGADRRPERLFSLDPQGNLEWSFDSAGGSPAIGPDGTIYAGHHSRLYALNPDGTVRWSFDHGPRGDPSVSGEAPTIDVAGNIYLTNAAGILYSLTSDGEIRWTYDLAPSFGGDIFPSMPVIDTDGRLYVGTGYLQTMVALVPEPATVFVVLPVLACVTRRRLRGWYQKRHLGIGRGVRGGGM